MRFAIIGVGCRLPGSSNSPEEYYNNLSQSKDCVRDIPEDRWNKDYFHSADKDEPAKMITKRGGFMDHFFDFDHQAFKMSMKEASNIDPQQKILLEVALQTFEDANVEYRKTNTAVFLGSGQVGFAKTATSDPYMINQYTASGSSLSIQSNMISYKFDLRGPSMVVDTACSSSGTAMNLALNSMRNGDCEMALVGGINMLLNHSMTIAFSKLGVLSPDGRCKSFDARANGYVRSEGAGFVLVKPLEAAIRDGDHIYTELLHCKTNEDGALSPSLTMPAADAQESVMRKTLEEANVDPKDVYYVEAHATGTVVGDSTEVNTIGRIFGEQRDENNKLRIGSVKSSIGHCECSSFIASLIKCCLMMDRNVLLPSIHFEQPNPDIHFDKYNMQVQTQVEPFDETPEEKIFSISSFGFGGANVCCLIKSFKNPETIKTEEETKHPESLPFMVHAQTKEALEARIQQLKEHFAENPEVPSGQVAFTLNSAYLPYRYLSHGIGKSFQDAQFSAPIRSMEGDKKPLCMVFSGQGPQHAKMCRELYKEVPKFREIIDRLDSLYKGITGVSVVNDLKMFQTKEICEESVVQQIQNTLPSLLFAQLGLYELWKSLGVEPDIIIGHSFGELTAIYAAGCISLEEVVAITAARASLMLKLDNQGTMCALGCGADKVNEMIEELGLENIWIAAYNSPQAVTVGGVHESIETIHKHASGQGIFSRRLAVTNAYHTPLLMPLREVAHKEFATAASAPKPPKRSIVSSVSGKLHTGSYSPQYFWSNIEQAVRFHQGIEEVRGHYSEEPVFLEISPHPVLRMSMKQIGCENVLGSIDRRKPELSTMYESAAKLCSFGQKVNWSIFTGKFERLRSIPRYPFQRKRCFAESIFNNNERLVPERDGNPHPLIGRQLHTVEETWMTKMNSKTLDWIQDHVVQNNPIFPGAGYIEMSMQALQTSSLKSVNVHQAMSVNDSEFRMVQTIVSNGKSEVYSSANGNNWTLHAEAETSPEKKSIECTPLGTAKSACRNRVDHIYDRFKLLDLHYGPHFRLLQDVFEGGDEALGIFDTSILTRLPSYYMHPSIVDNCFQCFLCCEQNLSRTYLPTHIDEINILSPLKENSDNVPKYVHCKLDYINDKKLVGNAVAYNSDGVPVLSINGFTCKAMPKATDSKDKDLFTMNWQTKKVPQIEIASESKIHDMSQMAHAMSHKTVSYVREACSLETVSPEKQEWWKWCLQLVREDMMESIVEEDTVIDSMGRDLREFLMNSKFDSTQSIALGQNPALKETIEVAIKKLEKVLQSDKMRNRMIRAYASPSWLADYFREFMKWENLDWIGPDEAADSHIDLIIHFGECKVQSVVENHIRCQIAPTTNSVHFFAYPDTFGHLDPIQKPTVDCGEYAINLSTCPAGTLPTQSSYDEVVVYKEDDPIKLLEIVQGLDSSKKILLIISYDRMRRIESSCLAGFGRVIANEYSNWDVKIVDTKTDDAAQWIEKIQEQPDCFEQEMRIENGSVVVPRLTRIEESKDASENQDAAHGYHLHVSQPGIINSLGWHKMGDEDVTEQPLESHEVLITVKAASLNFKDMMLTQGMLKGLQEDINLGLECSGVVSAVGADVKDYKAGDEVFGFGDQCLASHVVTSDKLIVHKPKNISHAEACSIPAVFVTAYFGLVYKAGLSENQSVLIHSAAGGVGQAAIQIAKLKKASDILATVGTQEKRDFLNSKYGVSTFANSHSTKWPSEFEAQSKNHVDVVLNSLSGQHIESGIKMLRPYGAFVEIGKRDILDNKALHLRPFLENLSYHSVHLDRMMSTREDLVGKLLQEISDHFENGNFAPNVDSVFTPKEIQAAFRHMQSGKHRGKIIINMEEKPDSIQKRTKALSPHKTYFLSGGLGAVGFEIARWMYAQGARDIVLMSRSGKTKVQQQRIIEECNNCIRVVKADVCNADEVKSMFQDPKNKALGGIVHLAMCLEDDRIPKLNRERFQKVLDPKITGAKNLINCCPSPAELDFVIFFSSISAIIGNAEQANYAAGNGFLDFYADHLTQQNIPTRVLNLGTVEDTGVIAKDFTLRKVLMTRGLLNHATCVKEICEYFMPNLIEGTATQIVPEIGLKAVCEENPGLRPVFGLLTAGQEDDDDSDGETGELNEDSYKETVGQLLQMSAGDVDLNEKLINYGVDSLLAVEMATIFSKKYSKNVSQMDILGGITGTQLLAK